MTRPALSVLIPHYGAAGPTRELVAQLLPQLAAADAEIVVVDDASPQPLGAVEGARIIRRDRNGGFGSAVNTGLKSAHGDLVAILNSDLIVPPKFLESFLEAARAWQPAVVAPQVVTRDHVGASTFSFPTARMVFAQRFSLLAARRDRRWVSGLIGEDRPRHVEDEYCVDWVSGAAMLIPTDLVRQAGGFDERFHMYLEEVDLQRRLRDLGVPAVYVGHVRVEHLGFASSDPARRERWQLESWFIYADKWGWTRRLRLALVGASLATLASESLRGLFGRDVHPLADWRHRQSLARSVWSAHVRREA